MRLISHKYTVDSVGVRSERYFKVCSFLEMKYRCARDEEVMLRCKGVVEGVVFLWKNESFAVDRDTCT